MSGYTEPAHRFIYKDIFDYRHAVIIECASSTILQPLPSAQSSNVLSLSVAFKITAPIIITFFIFACKGVILQSNFAKHVF